MTTALITGIAGQDGALLAEFLLKKGYRVIGVLPTGRYSDLFRLDYLRIRNRILFLSVNLLNPVEISALLEETRPDEFYNLAALSSVGISFQQPSETFDLTREVS